MHHQMVLLSHVRAETQARKLVTVMVLHDLSLAAQFADRLVLLAGGRLQADGPPAEVLDPELIGQLYGVAVERLSDSAGNPVIRPLGLRLPPRAQAVGRVKT
jgi:iron complex transport system ATP-binding protein